MNALSIPLLHHFFLPLSPGGRGGNRKILRYLLDYRIGFIQDFIIPEPENSESFACEPVVAALILLSMAGLLSSPPVPPPLRPPPSF